MTTSTTQTGSVSPTTGTSPSATPPATLGKDEFLKLLVGQLKNQDPMQPTDSSQWISQMAQFTQLEQVSNLAKSNEKIASSLSVSQTLSLIGRTVTYTDQGGNAVTGVVGKVDMTGGTATLTVGTQAGVTATSVTQVR
ncbi:MAG: hypothetical protein NVSMB25_20260 [Thermoleophilaceae bacterium]